MALKGLIDSLCDKFEFTVVIPTDKLIDNTVKNEDAAYRYIPLPWWCFEKHGEPAKVVKKELLDNYTELVELAKQHDILLTNTLTIPWLGFVANEIKKPHIWYVHEFGNIDHNLQFIVGYDKSLKTINNLSSRVLTISDAVVEHISQSISKKKIDIIHQAINLEKVIDLKPLTKNKPVKLLCMGAIKPSKGQHVAIDAVKSLINSGYEIYLDIVGPNANEIYVSKLQGSVKDVQQISVDVRAYDISEELSTHHALLMCSDNEALGRVTIEAMAASVPVIGYASPSTKYLIDKGRGYLYYKNTPKDLSHAIADFIDNKIHINTKYAKKFATSTYNPTVQSRDFIDCLEKARPVNDTANNAFSEYIKTLEDNSCFVSVRKKRSERLRTSLVKVTPKAVKKPIKKMVKKIVGA